MTKKQQEAWLRKEQTQATLRRIVAKIRVGQGMRVLREWVNPCCQETECDNCILNVKVKGKGQADCIRNWSHNEDRLGILESWLVSPLKKKAVAEPPKPKKFTQAQYEKGLSELALWYQKRNGG